MTHHSARAYALSCTAAACLLLGALPAHAQFQPRPVGNPATGESYHIEAAIGLWSPANQTIVSSEALGIVGSTIDFKTDLGLQDKRLPDFRLVARPARRHKLRFEYLPLNYTSSSTLRRTIVFNGQRYDIGLPVNSTFNWTMMRFGYEFDFISNDRGFAGFVLEAKHTDVRVELNTPLLNEFAQATAPVPSIGGTGRVYVVPNVSITGELTFFRLPENLIEDTKQRGDADRLALAGRRLRRRVGHGRHDREGALLRDRRALLIDAASGPGGDERRQPPVRLGERLVALAEAEAKLGSTFRRVLIEAAAGHGRHADILHQVSRERHIVGESERGDVGHDVVRA
jgi:hypothetical protein